MLPSVPLDKAAFFRDAGREIQRRLTDTQTLELLRNAELDLYSRPGETPEQFAARADEAAKAAADTETAKIRDRLEAKRDRLERALETARRRVEQASVEQSRARAPSSSPASAASSASCSAAKPTRARSRAPAVRSAAPRAAAA